MKYIFAGAAFLIGSLIFLGIIYLGVETDIQAHSQFLVEYLQIGSFPIPPLYYGALLVFSGFSENLTVLNFTATLVLGAAMGWKYLATYRLASWQGKDLPKGWTLAVVSLLLLFTVPVFYDYANLQMYLGKLASNVWHNSTTIFVMPAVIGLYYHSLRFLKSPETDWREVGMMGLYGVINILVKPSFMFVIIPVLPLFLLWKGGWGDRRVYVAGALSALFLIGVAGEYFLIYKLQYLNPIYEGDAAGVTIKPFAFWAYYSSNIPFDALMSLVFPIVFLWVYRGEIKKRESLQYSLLLFGVALLMGILMAETGVRARHGNFFWQIIMAKYVLFVSIAALALEKVGLHGWGDRRNKAVGIAFLLHVLSGVFYVGKIFLEGDYY